MCQQCGSVHSRWMGKCPDCGGWDTLEKMHEPAAEPASGDDRHSGLVSAWAEADGQSVELEAPIARPLTEIEAAEIERLPTGMSEFDRVLGGGVVPGSVAMFGGDPGIGKSTILLQVAGRLVTNRHRVLYVTSEESAYQTRLRAERILTEDGVAPSSAADASAADLDDLYVLADTNLARVIEQARQTRPAVLVIDSIQMIYKPDLDAAPGSVTQLRRCCTELVYLAKRTGMAVLLVGHVTKEGQLAGPKLLEHLVDVVLSFEGDQHHAHRLIRGIKNRYGATYEVGLFEMTGAGLAEVREHGLPAAGAEPRPGSVVCPAVLGSRCLLLEVQALTATGLIGSAKRRASGLDSNRLAMLIAVLEKHGGLRLADQDVFISAVGGLKVVEPATDLAVCLAIAGAHFRRTLPAGTAVVGEVGLGGEIRPSRQIEHRLREAARLGCTQVVTAEGIDPAAAVDGLEIQGVRSISEAIERLDTPSNRPPQPVQAEPETA